METIIARQPIFNTQKKLFAYKLLYRGLEELSLALVGGDRATSTVLTSSFLTEGLEKISNNRPCFVNFTEELLLQDVAANFPRDKIVVEILEDVQPTPAVITACKKLKEQGYTLALDDFVFDKKLTPLIELADIIKFDFRLTPIKQIDKALGYLASYDIEFLAEKVETYEEFHQALGLGCKYFQGYFFAKPEVMQIKELAAATVTLLGLVAEVNRPSIEKKRLTELISSDVSLSYKLLRYINSAYFSRVSKIDSISHAIAFLGENEVRRFITMLVISKMASNKPTELVRLAAIRAKFCEGLARASRKGANPEELFMLGLFSLLHAMLDTPIVEVINKIPVSKEVVLALTRQEGSLTNFLETVIAYEKREGHTCAKALSAIEVPEEKVTEIYLAAVGYADTLTRL
jgi:EAL and modified HD-GYP domain-containing signal transduction protein